MGTHTNTHAYIHRHTVCTNSHTLVEGPNKYRENVTKAARRNWAILTALIHQQTIMQSKVKCVLLFFALTELEKHLLNFYAYCILGLPPLSSVVKWNNLELEMGYSLCLSSSQSIAHTCNHTHTHQHIMLHDRQKNPCLSHHHFTFSAFSFSFFFALFFGIMKNVWYETLDLQRSTQLSAFLTQTQSDKMVTLSAHWQFIPD